MDTEGSRSSIIPTDIFTNIQLHRRCMSRLNLSTVLLHFTDAAFKHFANQVQPESLYLIQHYIRTRTSKLHITQFRYYGN